MAIIVEVKPTTIVPMGGGKGTETSKIQEVLYSDGSIAYRCAQCEKEFPRWVSTFAHIAVHGKQTAKASGKSADSRNKQIDRIIEMIDGLRNGPVDHKVAELTAALDAERKARRKAESDLKKIRSLLNPGE